MNTDPDRPPEYRYHLLRAAQERYQRNPSALDTDQGAQARRQADKTFELEDLVLGAPEARGLVISETQLDAALAEIAGRYPEPALFAEDLARNGLDEAVLRRALQRELAFDAVMARVAARAPSIGELDLRLFYELHRDRFTRPERRTVRQILITVNDDFVENRAAEALARLERLADRLVGRAQRFGVLARRHSECPSAMEDGRLGTVARGQLYPELDAALFALAEGEVSGVVGSELGFHLLWCEKIHPALSLPFNKVRDQVREVCEGRQRRNCQKVWIAQLRQSAEPGAPILAPGTGASLAPEAPIQARAAAGGCA
ncbi:MAG TPA: nitrogen fixation protein NifM [Chromatiaceae bacterium]|nr:nitrogen fixation protein NifM [Chromatiaceae bacterium]